MYFAYAFPYTYQDVQHDLLEIESDPKRRVYMTRKVLCKTIGGLDCDILTITEKGDLKTNQSKKAVVISARVHPGEVVGSWMMRGVLNYLTDPDSPEVQMLRQRFIFKIIPMLNPDGVINGNYRCSLAGCDLNRRWKVPNRKIHPTVYHTKKLIKELHEERGVILYCDLHGHSRKQNVFVYGCNNRQKPEECRVFPLILSKINKIFNFGYCKFGVQKSKDSTARVSLYKELKTCPNIFTIESTFSGMDFGEFKGEHLTQEHLESIGRDVCRSLLIYDNIFVPEDLRTIFPSDPAAQDMRAIFAKELINDQKLLKAGEGDSSGGSDSEPSEDNLPIEEAAKVLPILEKNQIKKLEKAIKLREEKEKEKEKLKQQLLKKKQEE